MGEINMQELKKMISDKIDNPFEMLKKNFGIFNKKWAESQKSGPLDRKEIDELIMETLNEGIKKADTDKK
ncbi:MAG: hypothetical protein COT16_00440 [Elusimicrobia bacterium CG08_land_8_20_14_0_20_44_26]|nr:MAG: hypothetical protein COT16_00440 [Elusimicrobia bacterium CG08_land_8_20_14_0_20_44_26]